MNIKISDVVEMVTVIIPEDYNGLRDIERIKHIDNVIHELPEGNKMVCWVTEDMLIENFKDNYCAVVYGRTSIGVKPDDNEMDDIILDTYELENINDVKEHISAVIVDDRIAIGINTTDIWEFGDEINTRTITYEGEIDEEMIGITNQKQYLLFVVMKSSLEEFKGAIEENGWKLV